MLKRSISDSWLQEYMRFTKDQESPEFFHLFSAFVILASVLNRQVYLDRTFHILYPNLYVILVAESQECRKGAAIEIAQDLLTDSLAICPKILSQKLSPEYLVEDLLPDARRSPTGVMRAVSSGLLINGELTNLLLHRRGDAGLLVLLVDLYDCPKHWSYGTRKHGREELINVYLNLLAACSPEYLRLALPPNEIGGGMLARTLFVNQFTPKCKNSLVKISEETKESYKVSHEKLLGDLLHISELDGEMKMTSEAADWYDDWYQKHDTSVYEKMLRPYYSKKAGHLLKIAMLLSVSVDNSLILGLDHLKAALGILDMNEKNLPNVLEMVTASEAGRKNNYVLEAVKTIIASGELPTRSLILRKVQHQLSSKDLEDPLQTLVQAEVLMEAKALDPQSGKPKLIYMLRR